jgi:TonB family protein
MLRRTLAAIVVMLAAASAAFAQADAEEARKELNLGARAYRAGRFAEAEQRFRRALELDPTQKNAQLFIARAVQQQYKPGVQTPENIALGEKAVAAYQEVLAKDPGNDDVYKAIVFIYGQMKNDGKVLELLLSRANDFSLPNDKRAEAFVILASRQWNCSYEITEQKENKTTEEKPDKIVIRYKMPADQGDFIHARQCVTEGLRLVEQAVALSPKYPNAWSYRANLLREAAKLAEMEGDAGQQAEYMRQYEEAVETQKRLAQEATSAKPAEDQAARAAGLVGEQGARADAPPAKRKVVVSGGILNSKAVSKPAPVYPPEAKAAGAQGTVTVKILVDEEGRVAEAEAVSGHPLLREAAVSAARNSRFVPTRLSGQPVKVSGVITYNFVLQ